MGVVKELISANGPAEMLALIRYSRKASAARAVMTSDLEPHWRYAYDALCNVSRSFALVIMQLHPDLRHPVCVFYLVLRALDTIEDDTSVDADVRRRLCKSFWTVLPAPVVGQSGSTLSGTGMNTSSRRLRLSACAPSPFAVAASPKHECDRDVKATRSYLAKDSHDRTDDPCLSTTFDGYGGENKEDEEDDGEGEGESGGVDENQHDPVPQPFVPWSSSEFGKGAEKELCQRFAEVINCFRSINPIHQQTIIDITRRMGKGMADHIYQMSCHTIDDYDRYCHYAAGLVGYGLTDIFVESSREPNLLAQHTYLSNSMGLFLQKTNIIRDYLEDITDGRTFWPQEIWGQYADCLDDLKDVANRKFAVACLNHMVMDALRHVPHCLEYMSLIRSRDVFNFVAIPQVMAVATLAECYNNERVFEGVVKVRRARTALLVLRSTDMDAVYKLFFQYAHRMLQAVEPRDPNAAGTRTILKSVIESCVPHVPAAPDLIIPNLVSIVLFCGLSSYVLKRRQEHFDGAVFTWRSAGGIMEPTDMLAVGALFLVCMYMFGFFLLPYMTKLQQDDWRRLQRENVVAHSRADDMSYARVTSLDENGTPM